MTFPALKIGDLISRIPVIQGGMGVGVSLSGLAAAVANAGGIGVIASVGIGLNEPDLFAHFREANTRALVKEIRKARELSRGIIGVNIMAALTNFAELVNASLQERIDIIFSGAGLPLDLPKYLKPGMHTKLAPIVSSGRAAAILCKKWLGRFQYRPDAFVVEGPLAGGHLGFKRDQIDQPHSKLEILVQEVLEAVKPFEQEQQAPIPVIAAGGIYTGADIFRMIAMGAAGVQMGTRFVATHECDADIRFKQAYLDACEKDIVIIQSPVGMPGRVIENQFIRDVNAGGKKPFQCPYHCLISCNYTTSPYCIALALINAQKGRLDQGFAFCGQNAHRVKEIVAVKDLMAALQREYESAAAMA